MCAVLGAEVGMHRLHRAGILQIPRSFVAVQRPEVRRHSERIGSRDQGAGGGMVSVHDLLRHLRPVVDAPGAQQPARQAPDSALWRIHYQL